MMKLIAEFWIEHGERNRYIIRTKIAFKAKRRRTESLDEKLVQIHCL